MPNRSVGLDTSFVKSAADVADALPIAVAAYASQLDHAMGSVGYYVLTGPDPQDSHKRDEVYLIAEGSGIFVHGNERSPFGPGDLIYVPAGTPHRFEDFGTRMATWVLFFGPAPT